MPEVLDKPFEMTLGDGTVVKGANMEEAFKVLAKMKEDTAAAYKAEKLQREQLASQVDELRTEVQRAKQPPARVEDGKFNKDRYYELLNQDPDAANSYWFESKFGAKPEALAQDYQATQQRVSNLVQQSVTASFIAQHAEEFPQTPESARAMRQKVEELTGRGWDFSVDTLNYAYQNLVETGSIKPLEKHEEPPNQPNPSLSGSGGQLSDTELARAEQMSDKELESLLRSKGMIR